MFSVGTVDHPMPDDEHPQDPDTRTEGEGETLDMPEGLDLRVVRDEDSPTGWKQEIGFFPGWETLPEW